VHADARVVLWRPIGPQELALVEASDWTAWPPRLPEQPIFYPVLNEEYATKIARDWNVTASGAGYVTRFRVRKSFLVRQACPVDSDGFIGAAAQRRSAALIDGYRAA
jgi:hypothetical protein